MTQNTLSIPLLSVVIPTYKRPHFLRGAIDSALQSAPNDDVEVIVVPNGPDESWKNIADFYENELRVHWCPIAIAHANAARNHGMRLARGKYIRFLDDDDYFYPAASAQLVELDNSRQDVSQGITNLVDTRGNILNQKTPNGIKDYATSMLHADRITLTCSLIYRNEKKTLQQWSETRKISQDVAWALSLCKEKDLSIKFFDGVVAAWTQHSGDRISTKKSLLEHHKEWETIISDTIQSLQLRDALTNERKDAAVDSLWLYAHRSFHRAPFFWSSKINNIKRISSQSRPQQKLFHLPLIRALDPLIVEWLVLPARLSWFGIRNIQKSLQS